MDLSTTYMGLKLSSPLVASASPLSRKIDSIKRMADSGAGAVVLWSLFEEQIEHDAEQLEHYLEYGTERFAESLTYFPHTELYHLGPDQYLEHIALAKKAVDIPIIASLNGVSPRGWVRYAAMAQEAGADAVELNVYYIPTQGKLTSGEVEDIYLSVLRAVKDRVSIPVAMKLSPFFWSRANFAARADEAGADALVLFNRFYQPDIDLENLEVRPNLILSSEAEMRLPLRWVAILRGHVKASLAATTGIHTGAGAAKMILAGADVVMMCSALLKNGIQHLRTVREELVRFLESKEYASVSQARGVLSLENCPEPAAFERANYMKALTTFERTATFE
jgi:dihydroorotate dehydrogenase (fumarate)